MGIRMTNKCWKRIFCNTEKEEKKDSKKFIMRNLLRLTVGKKCLTDHNAQNEACTVKPETQQINFRLSPENNAATIYYTIPQF